MKGEKKEASLLSLYGSVINCTLRLYEDKKKGPRTFFVVQQRPNIPIQS